MIENYDIGIDLSNIERFIKKPFETNKGIEYMPYPYGPVQNFPRA